MYGSTSLALGGGGWGQISMGKVLRKTWMTPYYIGVYGHYRAYIT